MRTLSELLFVGIRGMDAVTVLQGFHAAYKAELSRLRRQGVGVEKAQKEALQYAEGVTQRVQEGGAIHEQNPLQRGGSWAQLATMMLSQPNKMYRETLTGMRNLKAGRGSKTENIRRIMWSWFIANYTFNIIANQLVDEKYQQDQKSLAIETAVLGPFSGIIVAGPVFQTLMDHAMGKTWGYSGTPAAVGVDTAINAVDSATKGKWMNSLLYVVDTLGWLTGTPTRWITKPIRGSQSSSSSSRVPKPPKMPSANIPKPPKP